MLLIDAYNVLHAQWALPSAERGMDVPGLVRLIGRSRYADRRLRVVCDGRPGPQWPLSGLLETHAGLVWTRLGGAEVVFSGADQEADDVIEDVLDRAKGLRVLLVSSDRRLIRAAGQAGADQVGNGTFLKQLSADIKAKPGADRPAFVSEVPLDAYSVAHWMREFGYEPVAKLERPPQPEAPRPPKPARKKAAPKKAAAKTPTPDSFGDSLSIPTPSQASAPDAMPSLEDTSLPGNPEHEPLDPLLADAFEEWRGRLSMDDLDMSRWIDDVQDIKRPGSGRPGSGRRGPPRGGSSRRC